jgi:hypothetical protein
MSKAKLEQVERELSALDPEAMSFDHTDAEQCKLVLVRIAEKAADLCRAIEAAPSRDDQRPKGWQHDTNAMIRQATSSMPRGPRVLETRVEDVSKPAKTITMPKK